METCDRCSNAATCKGNTALNPTSPELAARRRCDDHCDHLSICIPIDEVPAEEPPSE